MEAGSAIHLRWHLPISAVNANFMIISYYPDFYPYAIDEECMAIQ